MLEHKITSKVVAFVIVQKIPKYLFKTRKWLRNERQGDLPKI